MGLEIVCKDFRRFIPQGGIWGVGVGANFQLSVVRNGARLWSLFML